MDFSTPAHVMEPPLVGERGFYVDLSRFYRPGIQGLEAQNAIYKEHYRRAYRWLRAAGEAEGCVRLPEEAAAAVARRAGGFINRELRRGRDRRGSVTRLFTDAFTCQGALSLPDTRAALCPRLISLSGVCGASACFLEPLAEAAQARGWDATVCPDPLYPERPAHLLLPELGLGFVSGPGGRRLHLDKTVYAAMDAAERESLREASALRASLLFKAEQELRLAKDAHDGLEALVNPYIDFSGVYALAERVASRLLGKAEG